MFRQKRQKETKDLNSARKPVISRGRYSGATVQARPGRDLSGRRRQIMDSTKDGRHRIFVRGFGLKKRLAVVLLFVVTLLSASASMTLSHDVQVKFYENNETYLYHERSYYQEFVSSQFTNDVTSQTKFTINTADIERKIADGLPEVDVAKIVLPVLGRRPTVVLSLRKPALLLMSTTNNGTAIDNNGVAFTEASRLDSELKSRLPIVLDESNIDIDIGKQAVTRDMVTFLNNFLGQASNKSLTVSKIVMSRRINGLDFYFDGISYFVKTDTSVDARQQFGSFYALINHISKEGGGAPKEYVDVRAVEKVYYK